MYNQKLSEYLFKAIEDNKLSKVSYILNLGADMSICNRYQESPLMVAVMHKRFEIAKELLGRGIEVDAKDFRENTPLMGAVASGQFDMAKMLVFFGADVEAKNESFKTPLMIAVMKAKFFGDDERICDYLLEKVRNVNAADKYGNTALINAVFCGNLEAVKKLVENGAYIDWQNKNGVTALMIASQRGYKDIVEYLIDNNADINLEDKLGIRAFDKSMNDEIAECFLERGYKFDDWVNFDKVLEHSNCYKVAKMAIENGADVEAIDDEGRLIFVEKAKDGNIGVLEAFIEAGIDVNIKCARTRKSAINEAVFKGHKNIVEILLKNGADANEKCRFEKRMLEESVLQGDLEIVELLIDYGAKINEEEHRNIYSYARNDEMVELLMKKGAKYRECDSEFLKDDFLETNSVKLAEMLLDLGVDVDVKNQFGKDTKLLRECRSLSSNEKMIELLIKRKSDVNILNENYGFPLSAAAENNNVSAMNLLLEGGANIDRQDFDGRSALYRAGVSNNREAVEFLIDKGADERLSDYKGDTVFDVANKEMKVILDNAIKKRDESGKKRKCDENKVVMNKSGLDFC